MRRGVLAAVLAAAGVVQACGSTSPSGGFVEIPGIGPTRVDVPRPASGSAAPCDADPLPEVGTASLEDRVAALRDIGFFAGYADETDAEVAQAVEAELAELWGEGLPVDDPIIELAVAEVDRERVWWRDLEADVVEENQVYVETLSAWREISVGAFEPVDIEEAWDGPSGPVTVGFTQAGTTHELSPAYLEDWIDPMILDGVNTALGDSDRRFHLYKAFDQSAYVVALTDAERQALEARGWCFE